MVNRFGYEDYRAPASGDIPLPLMPLPYWRIYELPAAVHADLAKANIFNVIGLVGFSFGSVFFWSGFPGAPSAMGFGATFGLVALVMIAQGIRIRRAIDTYRLWKIRTGVDK